MTLDPKKCTIGAEKTVLLGHIITKNGISLMPEKVLAIQELKTPTNKDQVRSICRSFAYFIDFVPNLMPTIAPLYDLLKRNKNFSWSNEHHKCFEQAKNALAAATVRNHRNSSFPLVVVSDASDVGCGAYLGQLNDKGEIEPLQFSSKVFSDAEKRQPIRCRELYAIFYAIKKWSSILIAEEFTVLSDHKSLEFLMNTRTNCLNIRLFNILYFLGHFTFKVVHIAGKDPKMVTADMLSRAFYFKSGQDREEENSEYEDPTHVVTKKVNNIEKLDILNLESLKVEQKIDAFCASKVDKKCFLIKDDLLYKTVKNVDLLVLPEKEALEVSEYCHRLKGHLGSKKLHNFLKTYFYAKNWDKICLKITTKCSDCIAVKHQSKLIGEKPKILDVEITPFTKVYFDLVDFGDQSKNGFRYGVSYQCELTRYLDIEPITDKTNISVATALIKLFLRYGVPDRAVCDTEVMGKVNKNLYDFFGIYVSNISPLRPQGNLVERAHREIGQLLKIYKIDIENWDVFMPILLFYYNTTEKSALNGLTPFEALYLRPPKSPLSLNTKLKIKNDWLKNFGDYSENIFLDIAKNHKKRFDAKKVLNTSVPETLKRHQRVLIFKPQKKGTSKKCYRTWDGPYVVLKKTAPAVYL